MAERDDDGFFGGTVDPTGGLEDARRRLADEQRRLDDLSKVWQEATTTVRAKDNTFTMTFNGRGELTDLAFQGTKYRTLAPAELAHRIVESLQQGKMESIEKMAATMGPGVPGLDVVGIASGKVDPRQAIKAMIKPLLQGAGAPGQDPREPRRG